MTLVAASAACGTAVDVPPDSTGAGAATASSSTTATGGMGGAGASTAVTGGGGTCGSTVADYGDCALPLGWVFDGSACVAKSGCGCEPDCEAFHEDVLGCIDLCPGVCDASAFLGAGLVGDGWGEGEYCDELYACMDPSDAALVGDLVGASLTCSVGGSCPQGEERCVLTQGVNVSAELMADLCRATRVASLSSWRCVVLGP